MASAILFSLNQNYLYEKNYLLLCLLTDTKIGWPSVNSGQGMLKDIRREAEAEASYFFTFCRIVAFVIIEMDKNDYF